MTVAAISAELRDFLESGISVLVGSRDRALVPDCCRALGVRVEAASGAVEITVFLPESAARTTIQNLHENGRIALAVSRPMDHRSVQVKGQVLSIRDADARDKGYIEGYREALAQTWGFVGVPLAVTRRLTHWPSQAVRFVVESAFEQTPGPRAGEVLR